MNIDGKTALVTGGGSGLGAQTARSLAAKGAKVAVLDLDQAAADSVASEINGISVQCDIRHEDEVSSALDSIEEQLGTPRIVINSAGIGTAHRILARDGVHPLDQFKRVVDVNLIGSFNILRLSAERMSTLELLESGDRGVIVMTASVAAFEGQIGQAAYAASKGGIVSLTLPAARELSTFAIRVLTLAPGLFKTPLMNELPEEVQEALGNSIPFPKRLGDAREFSELAVHCCENSYLNGEVIRIDGGMRLPPK